MELSVKNKNDNYLIINIYQINKQSKSGILVERSSEDN